jgi:hypothetical protein
MERASLIVGVVLSVLSLGSAFDTFTDIGLLPKLFVSAAAACLVIFGAASLLSKYVKPGQFNIGYGLQEPERSKARFALFSLALCALSILFVYLTLVLTQRFTLQLQEKTEADRSIALLIAPEASVDSVSVGIPADSKCDWKNKSRESLPPLGLQMIGWGSPIQRIQIDNFVHPQRVEIDCQPARSIRPNINVPRRTSIYLPDTLWTIRLVIIAAGGLIWLIACAAMWSWSE